MTNFESKTSKVLWHLKKYKSITSWEAIQNYKATRLSAIIFELKKRGYVFETVREDNIETGSHYSRYYLIASPHNPNIKENIERLKSLILQCKKM